MKYSILLDRQANTATHENEEKSKFIRSILEVLNIDLDFWSEEEELTPLMRMKVRKALTQYDLKVIEQVDGHLDIYFESSLIAEWRKPNYSIKIDHSEVDKTKKMFLEMEVNFWSVFEEDDSESDTT